MKNLLLVLFAFIYSNISAQNGKIPDWFLSDVKQMQGVWIADNSAYKNDQETFVKYEIVWKSGLGATSIKGELAGVSEKGEKTILWEFRQYWDNETQKAMVIQFGNGNMIGIGEMISVAENQTELIQTFSLNDGRTWPGKHESMVKGNTLITSSFEQNQDKTWKKDRTYTWYKQS